MAEILSSFEFKGGVGGPKHPWETWLDGQIRKLTAADFGAGVKAKYLASQARNQAAKRFKKVRININETEGWLILQATDMTEQERAQAVNKAEEKKAAKEADKDDRPAGDTQDQPKEEQQQEEQPKQEQPAKGRKGRKQS